MDDDTICDDGRNAEGIETSAESVVSYHSRNDGTVCYIYELSGFGSVLGCKGPDCGWWVFDGETPANFTARNVTHDVDGHCDYIRPDVGYIDRVVADF